MPEDYPPIRFKRGAKLLLQKRAARKAKVLGLESLSIAAYVMMASDAFEKEVNNEK
jgi:hypothetical protein